MTILLGHLKHNLNIFGAFKHKKIAITEVVQRRKYYSKKIIFLKVTVFDFLMSSIFFKIEPPEFFYTNPMSLLFACKNIKVILTKNQ